MEIEEIIELMKFAMAIEREHSEETYEELKENLEERLEMDLYRIENNISELKSLITGNDEDTL